MQKNEHNIIAVHCKAGKGRTGSLCCAWLMYSQGQHVPDGINAPEDALEWFADARTDSVKSKGKKHGVETPSQVRYVRSLWTHLTRTESWLNSPKPPPGCRKPTITLRSLFLENDFIAEPDEMKRIKVLVQCGGSKIDELVLETESFDPAVVEIPLGDVVVQGDFRVSLFEEKERNFSAQQAMLAVPNAMSAQGLIFMFLVHTDFMQVESLPSTERSKQAEEQRVQFKLRVDELEKANKKVKKGKHSEGSSICLEYSRGGIMPSSGFSTAGGGRKVADLEEQVVQLFEQNAQLTKDAQAQKQLLLMQQVDFSVL